MRSHIDLTAAATLLIDDSLPTIDHGHVEDRMYFVVSFPSRTTTLASIGITFTNW